MKRIPALPMQASGCSSEAPRASPPTASTTSVRHPSSQNFFIAAGFNSTGFLTGPGIGSVLADWLVDGRPSIDLPEADPARVMPHETNRRFLEQRVNETLDVAYDMHWPYFQRHSARPLRRSPLHDRTAANGAVFGELLWLGTAQLVSPRGRAIANMCTHTVVRTGSSTPRQNIERFAKRSAFSTYPRTGSSPCRAAMRCTVLQRICTADIDVEPGRIVYTQWLNRFGGIEADVTVTRLRVD